MQLNNLVCSITVSLVSGIMGYLIHGLQPENYSLSLQKIPALEYFVDKQSFSEVENAKAWLEGISERYVTELRAKLMTGGASLETVSQLITEMRGRINEFKGTQQEL